MGRVTADPTPLERRVLRRMVARGKEGLGEALLAFKGVTLGGRYQLDSLYAVGGEGAVYRVHDLRHPTGPGAVAKIALHPLHRPFELDGSEIRRVRENLRLEADHLTRNVSMYLPDALGFYDFENPLLDAARGGAFAEPEPVLLMERLPGRDLDTWLARMHRSGMRADLMRRTLDRVAVVLLQALVDLIATGYLYADLRPANLRMMGHGVRRIRLLDAGSLVAVGDRTGRFPHVPAYLPPMLFFQREEGRPIYPTAEYQAVMAGRTLYEAATGYTPRPGQGVNLGFLECSNVSPPVATVIAGLCEGQFQNVADALSYLESRAKRRVAAGNAPTTAAGHPKMRVTPPPPLPEVSRSVWNVKRLSPWRRLLDRLRGR